MQLSDFIAERAHLFSKGDLCAMHETMAFPCVIYAKDQAIPVLNAQGYGDVLAECYTRFRTRHTGPLNVRILDCRRIFSDGLVQLRYESENERGEPTFQADATYLCTQTDTGDWKVFLIELPTIALQQPSQA